MSDLPEGFNLNGAIQLYPDQPQAQITEQTSDFPQLAASLVLKKRDNLTITVPIKIVNTHIAGSSLTHTITVTSPDLAQSVYIQAPIYITQTTDITTKTYEIYLPIAYPKKGSEEIIRPTLNKNPDGFMKRWGVGRN